jgi:hypothetical protein
MGQQFRFDQDEVWAEAERLAEIEVAKVQKVVAARCRELGIPDEFAPSLDLRWSHRGYGNSTNDRRTELRRMAVRRIEAIEAKAITEIELSCLKGQEEIALAGLGTAAAKAFIERLPSIEALMPALSFDEIAGKSDPPISTQLIAATALNPNALRQQRHRDKLKALRNGSVTPQIENVTPPPTK